jgi:hypothetical protein
MRRLTDVRRDIVHTIRQAVDVVSKYARGAFAEPAKNRVRGFILGLLHRWASKAGSSTAGFAASATMASERERGVVSAGGTVAAAASGTGAAVRRGQQRRQRKENAEVLILDSHLHRVPGLLRLVHLHHQENPGHS